MGWTDPIILHSQMFCMASIFIRMKIIATLSPFIDHYTVSTTKKTNNKQAHNKRAHSNNNFIVDIVCGADVYTLFDYVYRLSRYDHFIRG